MATVDKILAIDRLQKWFTPTRPVRSAEYLSGRLSLLYRMSDAINTEGQHVVLFGDRGIGKTSVARVAAFMLQESDKHDGRRAILISCDSGDDFGSIWKKVFQEVLLEQRQLGFAQQSAMEITGSFNPGDSIDSPNDVRILMRSFRNPCLIFIDEFDRVPQDNNARTLMADTIKLFSDASVNATIVIIGVAESLRELFTSHESISRNILPIQVEPMETPEMAEIISKGYANSGLAYESGLDYRVAMLSQGYPHYAHLLGLWAGRVAVEQDSQIVTQQHLEAAIPLTVANAAGGIQQAYEAAIESSQPGNLFREVLLACSLADKDSRGRFSIAALREPLQQILGSGRRSDRVAYQGHLARFCTPEHGPTLRRSGSRHNFRWQFINPQIIPFIQLQGIKQGLLED